MEEFGYYTVWRRNLLLKNIADDLKNQMRTPREQEASTSLRIRYGLGIRVPNPKSVCVPNTGWVRVPNPKEQFRATSEERKDG